MFEEELGRPGVPAQGTPLVRRPDAGDRRTMPRQAGRHRPRGHRLPPVDARVRSPAGLAAAAHGAGTPAAAGARPHADHWRSRRPAAISTAARREADVAGHLAHRLFREGVVPVDLRVASDDRLARFRQPTFKAAPIMQRATIAVTGRRLGPLRLGHPHGLIRARRARVPSQAMPWRRWSMPPASSSRGPARRSAEVFRRAKRIYEKFNAPHEWTLDYQGVLIGYSPREVAPHARQQPGPRVRHARLLESERRPRPARRTPSSSMSAATRSSPPRRTGPRSRSPSRATR